MSEGGIRVSSPVFAKSKLTPIGNKTIKPIPRVEICAAKICVEVYNVVDRELNLVLSEIKFWSDSQTTLTYIW